jgi:hypothetical protein
MVRGARRRARHVKAPPRLQCLVVRSPRAVRRSGRKARASTREVAVPQQRRHHRLRYHCRAAVGRVACAQMPYGACTESQGKVYCWDPSPEVIHASGGTLPKPGCLTGSNVDCGCSGDHVTRSGGVLEDARGQCSHPGGHLACWDRPLSSDTLDRGRSGNGFSGALQPSKDLAGDRPRDHGAQVERT